MEVDNNTNSIGGENMGSALQDLMTQLFEEFEYFGVCEDRPRNVVEYSLRDLLMNTFKLINIHHKSIAELKTAKIEQVRLKQENQNLQKRIANFEKENAKQKSQYAELRKKYLLSKSECNDYIVNKERTQKQLLYLQNKVHKKEIQHQSLEKTTIDHISSIDAISDFIKKYNKNETIYQETIRKLEDNNRGLLNEILKLKEEITAVFFNKHDSTNNNNNLYLAIHN